MLTLDHLAVACTDLAEGTAWVEERLGVKLQPGGQHARYGTHNTLLGLGDDLYLEVIAKEPGAEPEAGHAWFGLDHFTGPPRLANWICQTDNFSAAPEEAGPPRALTRGDLSWRITVPDDGSLPFGGGYPTLIQWAEGTRHPAERLPDSGCRLTALEVSHPGAERLSKMMRFHDPRIAIHTGPLKLQATFDTPIGQRSLS
ncbi:MAG: VOC family protein [Pseudomonadota bacterium]